jgi:hypothetical protein
MGRRLFLVGCVGFGDLCPEEGYLMSLDKIVVGIRGDHEAGAAWMWR